MSTTGPVPITRRINAIDAVRGFALIGILMVNMQFFSEPFGDYLRQAPPPGSSTADLVAFYGVKTFAEGKFYPLFSMLFGIGLALQWRRAEESGRKFLGTGLRRLAALGVLGLMHGFLIWYGDILFLYSTAGFVLLLLLVNRAKAKTLAFVGAGLMGVALLMTLEYGAIGALTLPQQPAETNATPAPELQGGEPSPETPLAESPVEDPQDAAESNEPVASESDMTPMDRAIALLLDRKQWRGVGLPLSTLVWMEAEEEAYRDGPYRQALFFRASSYVFYLIFCMFGFWWHVAAMFCFGAAMLKAGLFEPRHAHWMRRLAVIGLAVGVPLNVLYAMMPTIAPTWAFLAFGQSILMIGGPILSLACLGAISWLIQSGKLALVTDTLSKVGRMALTNYLLQSTIATGVFYHWGLGLFGQTMPAQRVGIVLAIYAVNIIVSLLWLRVFRFGPMEWLWRTMTYMRPQPLRYRAGERTPD